jgi:hypothetical protein
MVCGVARTGFEHPMIVFDLKCKAGHVFEAWFPDSAGFERQKKKRQVTCPACGDTQVSKAPMAPRIATNKTDEDVPAQTTQAMMTASPEAQAMLAKLKELKAHVEKNCDYVGDRFADEARKIHYGETGKRNIYGESSDEQARELAEEGVEFQRIPWIRSDA